jgi:arylsulfatase A-like enzyme
MNIVTKIIHTILVISFFLTVKIGLSEQPVLPEKPSVKQNDKPNIILIYADDMGWADVNYLGFKNAGFYETPNIDRLAKEGMIFHRFYPSAANCAPSRASMITGTYSPRHHVYLPQGYSSGGAIEAMRWKTPTHDAPSSFLDAFKVNVNHVSPEFESFAEVLNKAGYATARLGKWHIGDDNQGFDLSSSEGTPNFITNIDGEEGRYYTDTTVARRLTDAAIDFMHENRNRPFFIYLAHWEPHGPLAAKEDRIAYYTKKLGELIGENEENKAHFEALREPLRLNDAATYAAMIEQLDISTGRVMDALEALQLEENTMIIFTSDNGAITSRSSNYPLRAGKGSFYEGGIRTPFAVRWPAVIKQGTESDLAINGIDLLPTFAEMASAPLPQSQPVDGLSILPILKGTDDQFDTNRALFFHFPLYLGGGKRSLTAPDAQLPTLSGRNNFWRAVPSSIIIKGEHKLIYYYEYDSYELFNLKEDISEQYDISERRPELAKELFFELKEWVKNTQAPVPNIPNPLYNPQYPEGTRQNKEN